MGAQLPENDDPRQTVAVNRVSGFAITGKEDGAKHRAEGYSATYAQMEITQLQPFAATGPRREDRTPMVRLPANTNFYWDGERGAAPRGGRVSRRTLPG